MKFPILVAATHWPNLGAKNFVVFRRRKILVRDVIFYFVTFFMLLSHEEVRRWGNRHVRVWAAEPQWQCP